MHWTEVFTSKLSDSVKLVGSTISCESKQRRVGPEHNEETYRSNPHVQSYAVATDYMGLRVLMAAKTVFACFDSIDDTIFYSELGSSKAILDAGYTIDSLMVRARLVQAPSELLSRCSHLTFNGAQMRYQGVDWQNTANWACNNGISPYGRGTNDGASLEAMEVRRSGFKG